MSSPLSISIKLSRELDKYRLMTIHSLSRKAERDPAQAGGEKQPPIIPLGNCTVIFPDTIILSQVKQLILSETHLWNPSRHYIIKERQRNNLQIEKKFCEFLCPTSSSPSSQFLTAIHLMTKPPFTSVHITFYKTFIQSWSHLFSLWSLPVQYASTSSAHSIFNQPATFKEVSFLLHDAFQFTLQCTCNKIGTLIR